MNASKHVCDIAYCAGVLYAQTLNYKHSKPSSFSVYINKYYEKRMLHLVNAGAYEPGQGFSDQRLSSWFERGRKGIEPTKKMIEYYDYISRMHGWPMWDEAQKSLELDSRWY